MSEREPSLPYEHAISWTSEELAEKIEEMKKMGASDEAVEVLRGLPPELAACYVDNFIAVSKTADSEFKAPDWWEQLKK